MAFTLGGVTVPDGEKPIDGDVMYSDPPLIARANPLGYSGRIETKQGSDAREHTLRLPLKDATRVLFQALADAAFGTQYAWVWSDGNMAINTTVTIEHFIAKKNRTWGPTDRFDCELVLVEV